MPKESENSNNVLDKFFEYSIDLLCIADIDGNFVKLNPEWEKTLGYSTKELEGKPYLDYVHPDDIQATIKAGQKLANKKIIENFTNRYRHKDGSYRWLEWRSFPHNGKIYASARDVTKLKKTEEDLKLFKISIDNANDAVYWLNENAYFEYVNDKACKTLGYSREEFLKLTIFNIDTEMTKVKWDSHWKQYQTYRSKGGVNMQVESTYRRKDGCDYPVEISLTHFWKDDREFHIAHIRDITERKQHQQALWRSEEKYKSLFKNMPYSFSVYRMIYDEKGNPVNYVFEEVNPASEHFTGISPDKMIGKKVKDLFPNTEDHWIQTFGNVAKTGNPINFTDYSVEFNKYFETFVFSPGKDLCAILFNDVTERKKNELELINNQKLLSESQRIANIGSWEYIIDKDELNWNDQTYKIYGVDKSIKPNYKISNDLIHPDDRKLAEEKYKDSLETGIFAEYEYRIIRSDNSIRYVKIVGDVEFDTNKNPYRTFGIIQDITKQKKQEEEILKSQKLLNESQRISRMGSWEIDLGDESVYWSESTYQLCGIDKNKIDLTQDTFLNLVHPEDRNYISQQIKRAITSGRVDNDEFRIIRTDGQIRNIIATAEVLKDINNKPIKLVGLMQDITEKKIALQALEISEQKMESLFRVVPAGIGIIKDRLLVEVNPEGCKISGYSKEELIGKSTRMLYLTEEEYLRVGKILYEKSSGGDSSSVETVWRRKDGKPINIYIALIPIDLNDLSKGIVFTVLDITERKQYEEALEKRVLALTRPLGDIESINFMDLFNMEELQELQDSFANATGVASIITYPDGTPITKPSNFCGLCELIRSTEEGRNNCKASDAHIGKQNLNSPRIQPCLSAGLWDAGASITLGGVHIANWLIGQVKNDELREKDILSYADNIGIKRDVFKEEFENVKVMSKEQFQAVANAHFLLANEISLKSYQNLQQARLISEQKEYEKKIIEEKIKTEESEQRFKALHNASFGGIFIHDKGVIIDCNQGLSDMTGYSFDELIGMNGLLLVPEQCRDTIKSNMAIGLEDAYEITGIRKNGEEYPLRIEARNIPYKGRTVRTVEFRDITEQKQTEIELVKAKDRAEESEFFLQESQRTGNIGSYKMSFKTGCWISTETLDRIFGIDETFDKNVDGWLDMVHLEDRESMATYFKNEVIAKQQPFNKEYRIVRKEDKVTRWMHGVGKLYFDSSGNLSMMLGTIQDITDRKLIEEQRKRMNIELELRVEERTVQLQQLNKDLEAFAYSISHDLRAPLRHINGYMQLMKNVISPMGPKVQNYYDKISISAKGMSVMIDELLKFSRLGRAKLNLSPVSLTDIVNKVIQQFEPDYKERNIEWEIIDLPVVTGDEALLKLVFENLISNAIKYTSKEEFARIEIGTCEKDKEKACVFVQDNGVGFDIAYKDKLFGVFQRLHKQDDFEGIGVGLANVNQIIKKHNGHIDVDSEVNKGTTFYITLPVK